MTVGASRRSPSLATHLVGAALWAAVMGLSPVACLWVRGWLQSSSIEAVGLVYAIGGGLAFPPALRICYRGARDRGFEGRFAWAFLIFTATTILVTAVVYALDYRSYYAAWHDDALTKTWLIQFGFTTAGALAQFAVTGIRLYFPIGFIGLLAASLWFARQPR